MFSTLFSGTKKRKNINPNKTRKFKKMNCSPLVAGKTVNPYSCLDRKILFDIKAAYNKDHPDNIIYSTNPNEVWLQLKDRLDGCEKEECWLKELDDKNMRKNIQNYVFAPKHPPEWNKNPNEWLSNFDIADVMEQYEKTYKNFEFIGPTTIDFDEKLKERNNMCVWEELCKFSLSQQIKRGKTKIGIVFNLDKHDQSGSHWVSLFIDIKDLYIFYFDSNGVTVPKEIKRLCDRIIEQGIQNKLPFKFYQNTMEHQKGNTECGMYSLFFIITFLTNRIDFLDKQGRKMVKKFQTPYDKIRYFKKNRIPDKYVEQYRKIYFND